MHQVTLKCRVTWVASSIPSCCVGDAVGYPLVRAMTSEKGALTDIRSLAAVHHGTTASPEAPAKKFI